MKTLLSWSSVLVYNILKKTPVLNKNKVKISANSYSTDSNKLFIQGVDNLIHPDLEVVILS